MSENLKKYWFSTKDKLLNCLDKAADGAAHTSLPGAAGESLLCQQKPVHQSVLQGMIYVKDTYSAHQKLTPWKLQIFYLL